MPTVKVLAVGDICADIGVLALQKFLPGLITAHKIDFTIVNGENALNGEGLDAPLASLFFKSGADVITGGNHSLQDFNLRERFIENSCVLRPANIPEVGGSGSVLVKKNGIDYQVLNLLGREHMRPVDSPFAYADSFFARAPKCITIVDFHAESSEEKEAFGFYVDGRASLVFGTHTHVQTTDEKILPAGTGYITDIGFVGARDSVIGTRAEYAIERQRFAFTKSKRWTAHGKAIFSALLAEIDPTTQKTLSLTRLLETLEV